MCYTQQQPLQALYFVRLSASAQADAFFHPASLCHCVPKMGSVGTTLSSAVVRDMTAYPRREHTISARIISNAIDVSLSKRWLFNSGLPLRNEVSVVSEPVFRVIHPLAGRYSQRSPTQNHVHRRESENSLGVPWVADV
jgi:hypothetical protein